MLMFDLADVAKALAQFEHSSEMLALILVASQEATKAIWASNGGRRSISWTLVPLALGFSCFCLWLCWSSCAPVEHGSCWVVPDGVFGCRGMLRAFVRYPPATSDTDKLLSNSCYTGPCGSFMTSVGQCVQPERGLRWAT